MIMLSKRQFDCDDAAETHGWQLPELSFSASRTGCKLTRRSSPKL